MSLAEEEHTHTTLSYPAANGVRKLASNKCAVERKRETLLASAFLKLTKESVFVYSDAHARKLESDIENGIINENISVERPVVVVGGSAVVRLTGRKLVTDTDDKNGTVFTHGGVFSFLCSLAGVLFEKFLRSEEGYLVGKKSVNEFVVVNYVVFRVPERTVDTADETLQRFERAFLVLDNALPVPLVNENGMDIVRFLIAANGVHIRVKTFSYGELIICKSLTLPLRKGVYYLHLSAGEQVKGNRTLVSVQRIVETAFGINENGSRNSGKIQLYRKVALKKILDLLDSHLCLTHCKKGSVSFGNVKTHIDLSFAVNDGIGKQIIVIMIYSITAALCLSTDLHFFEYSYRFSAIFYMRIHKCGEIMMKKILNLCCAILVITPLLNILPTGTDLSIYDNVIRLHILASSDEAEDQALKLHVRDSVLSFVDSIVAEAKNKTEAEALIRESLSDIEAAAKEAVCDYGADDAVTVTLTEEAYPRRTYGFASLPSGKYTSLRIMLGEAEGANWWCVLFPRLCTAPATVTAEDEEDNFIAVGFTPSQYKIITESSDARYVIKFRIIEIIESIFD